jgi:hypothetical protein
MLNIMQHYKVVLSFWNDELDKILVYFGNKYVPAT